MRTLPELRDVNTDQQNHGWKPVSSIDRDTASRLGITPAAIDNALYDAFGQRQVSTMYKPLNQYHVVMEVDPQLPADPDALKSIYVRFAQRARRFRSRVRALRAVHSRARRQSLRASFPRSRSPSTWRRALRSGEAVDGIDRREAARSACRPRFMAAFTAPRRLSKPRSPTSRS